jgi:hypothetical protein
VDSQIITAYAGLIGAVVALLGLIGGGISFVIRRADRRRETGETELVAHLRKQIRNLKRKLTAREADGSAWKDQLLKNDIEPTPSHWTPFLEEDE